MFKLSSCLTSTLLLSFTLFTLESPLIANLVTTPKELDQKIREANSSSTPFTITLGADIRIGEEPTLRPGEAFRFQPFHTNHYFKPTDNPSFTIDGNGKKILNTGRGNSAVGGFLSGANS